MAEGRIEKALRGPKVTAKEIDARRIEIECVEPPGGGAEGYIVTVCPKDKNSEPGKTHKGGGMSYTEPIKRVFESEEAVIEYLKKVL